MSRGNDSYVNYDQNQRGGGGILDGPADAESRSFMDNKSGDQNTFLTGGDQAYGYQYQNQGQGNQHNRGYSGAKGLANLIGNHVNLNDLVSKLNNAEDKLGQLVQEHQHKDKTYKYRGKKVKAKTEELIDFIKDHRLSQEPDLDEAVHKGVEKRLLESAADIARLKRENQELKNLLKNKNRYIEELHDEIQQLKGDLQRRNQNINYMNNQIAQKDQNLFQNQAYMDNEYKANAMKHNLRQSRQQNDKMFQNNAQNIIQKNENDFWKTSNEEYQENIAQNASQYKPIDRSQNLKDIIGSGSNLFIQDSNAQRPSRDGSASQLNFEQDPQVRASLDPSQGYKGQTYLSPNYQQQHGGGREAERKDTSDFWKQAEEPSDRYAPNYGGMGGGNGSMPDTPSSNLFGKNASQFRYQ